MSATHVAVGTTTVSSPSLGAVSASRSIAILATEIWTNAPVVGETLVNPVKAGAAIIVTSAFAKNVRIQMHAETAASMHAPVALRTA
mmetsp:Transcript_27599/g.40592  ORF Transcript_27599/g.40592 Transcript_27599/m.40592 type:complete len:87 (+) Transcript_27599:64-324(+)